MAQIDEECVAKISKFWDGANDRPLFAKFWTFFNMLTSQKRLPVSGWTRSLLRSRGSRVGWWHNPFVVKRINQRICGREVEGRGQGLIEWLRDSYGCLFPLAKGISVGCGDGSKEALLLEAGIVGSFDLYELSEKSVERGRSLSNQRALSERMRFHRGFAFEEVRTPASYDFVIWNDALHHMPSVDEALAWSRMILRTGGIFALDDFVGATRFQWPDHQLKMATAIRNAIPAHYRAVPNKPFEYFPLMVERPTVASMIEMDPSEAADSERILPALKEYFPEVAVRHTGGVVYHLALNQIMHNFDPESDRSLLELLMLIDEQCMRAGDTHYAAAIGQKTEQEL